MNFYILNTDSSSGVNLKHSANQIPCLRWYILRYFIRSILNKIKNTLYSLVKQSYVIIAEWELSSNESK
jgi:hypothetical protein